MKIYLKTAYADDDVELSVHPYASAPSALALLAKDAETGEPISKPTVYLEGVSEKLAPNEILLKDYSENEGMVDAFEKLCLGHRTKQVQLDIWKFVVESPTLLKEMQEVRDQFAQPV